MSHFFRCHEMQKIISNAIKIVCVTIALISCQQDTELPSNPNIIDLTNVKPIGTTRQQVLEIAAKYGLQDSVLRPGAPADLNVADAVIPYLPLEFFENNFSIHNRKRDHIGSLATLQKAVLNDEIKSVKAYFDFIETKVPKLIDIKFGGQDQYTTYKKKWLNTPDVRMYYPKPIPDTNMPYEMVTLVTPIEDMEYKYFSENAYIRLNKAE
jgi:hypothetical protein